LDPRLIAAARSPETFKDAEPSPDGTAPAMRGSGERIFGREGCARCHTPPLYTNNKLTLAEGFTPPGDIPTTLDVLLILSVQIRDWPWPRAKERVTTKCPPLEGSGIAAITCTTGQCHARGDVRSGPRERALKQRKRNDETLDSRSPSVSSDESARDFVRHVSNVEIAGREAAPKDLSRSDSDHPTERTGEVCRIRETGRIRCIRHRRAARELAGTTLQTQPEQVRS
jgi:hypothetical protein